jgi:hypothetical protein
LLAGESNVVLVTLGGKERMKKYVEEWQIEKGHKEEQIRKKNTKYGGYKNMYSMLPALLEFNLSKPTGHVTHHHFNI